MQCTLSPAVDQEGRTINCLLDHEIAGIGNSVLFNFVKTAASPAQLKDAQTGKYLLSNLHFIEKPCSQSAYDLTGLTIDDVFSKDGLWQQDFSPVFTHWKAKEQEKIKKFDALVRSTQCPITIRRILFTFEGFILFQKFIKLPVPSHDNKKIIAILSYSHDLTFRLGLSNLFQLYRKYYPDSEAISQILKYLKISDYFTSLPTVRETQVLFAMHQHDNRKILARLLDISPNTVAVYVQHLKEKLTMPLYKLLMQLRTIPVSAYGHRHA